MKVGNCEKCKHCERRSWVTVHKPNGYHAIGITHVYAFCTLHKMRCSTIKYCGVKTDKEVKSHDN